jgi:uncharacterized protein (TIGR02646 family)
VHKLDRTSVPRPNCLDPATTVGRNYGHLRGPEKEEIREALVRMQQSRCAYCERRLADGRDDGHIEHFRNQANHAQNDLDWDNLFWSCTDEKTCGKHKDKCSRAGGGPLRVFDPAHVIKPCTDDPEEFFLFVVDGTIRPRTGLDAARLQRAEETLRVLQLNDSALLRKSREDAVHPYIGAIDAMLRAAPSIVGRYILDELDRIRGAPFETAVRRFLESMLS